MQDDLLDRIRANPWGSLGDRAEGERLGEILVKLASRPNIDSQWDTGLEAALLPQLALCEATYEALPFLVEMVQRRWHLPTIYDVLVSVGACCGSHAFDDMVPSPASPGESLAAACRRRLGDGYEAYRRDVSNRHLDRETRLNALSMLSRLFPNGEWRTELERLLATETDAHFVKDAASFF